MRNRLVIIASTLVVVLIAVLIGGEVIARHTAKKCISRSFEGELGTNVSIGLSGEPMLWQLMTGELPYVRIDSDDSAFGMAQGMVVHARVTDVKLSDSSSSAGSVGSSTAEVQWPASGILKTLKNQGITALISDVTTEPSSGTIVFHVGALASVSVHPQIDKDKITVTTTNAQLLGVGLPQNVVDGIVNAVASNLQVYPVGMRPTSISVTDDAVNVSLRGDHFDLPASSGSGSSCGVFS